MRLAPQQNLSVRLPGQADWGTEQQIVVIYSLSSVFAPLSMHSTLLTDRCQDGVHGKMGKADDSQVFSDSSGMHSLLCDNNNHLLRVIVSQYTYMLWSS